MRPACPVRAAAVLRVTAVLATILTSVPARAEGVAAPTAGSSVIELSAAPAQVAEASVKLGVAGLVTEIRLRNTAREASADRVYQLGPTLRRTGDGLARPATWTRLDGAPVGSSKVAPGTEAILQLAAHLPLAGIYETWIDTAAPGADGTPQAPDRRVRVVVTREAATVPGDLLEEPKPVRRLSWWPFDDGATKVVLEMRNGTDRAIDLAAPSVLAYDLKSGDRLEAVAQGRPPSLDASSCPTSIGAGTPCPLILSLPPAGPGQYAVDVAVVGAAGGVSRRTVPVSVRLPLLYAVLVTALGVGCGWYVQSWRAGGRRALDGMIQAGTLRRRVEAVLGPAPEASLRALGQPILDDLAAAEEGLRSGADAGTELAALSARAARLAALAPLERAYLALPSPAEAMLRPLHGDVLAKAATPPSDENVTAFRAAAAALADGINGWPALAAASAVATATLAQFRRLLAFSADEEACAPVRAAIAALIAGSSAALADLSSSAPPGTVAQREAALRTVVEQQERAVSDALGPFRDALRARMETAEASNPTPGRRRTVLAALAAAEVGPLAGRIDGLARAVAELQRGAGAEAVQAAPPPGPSPPVPTGLSGLEVPVALAFGLTGHRSVGSLTRERRRHEFITNVIVLVATSLGVAAYAASGDAWGSATDLIAAFLGGIGTRLAVGALPAGQAPAAR